MTFVCVLRSGGVYSPVWVERLCRQVREHLKPDRIVCLCDLSPHQEAFGSFSVYREVIPLVHNWPGWWSKLELFRPGLFSGRCFYADLDTLICRPIPDLAAKIELWGKSVPAAAHLALLSDFYCPTRPASGAMLWIPSVYTEAIYHTFARDPAKAMLTRHGDGGFIGLFPHARLQAMFPNTFASYKAHKLHATSAGFPVVCFHGKPKQNDLPPLSWARRYWEGR